MRGHCAFLLSALLCTCDGGPATASEFWFAASEISGNPGPAALTACVCGEIGSQFDIHVWAQPDTFATLRNFSLDLTSDNSAALDFTAVEINNSSSGGERFQYVFDSTPTAGLTPVVIETSPDQVPGIQGFTVLSTGGGIYQGLDNTVKLVTVTFELASAETTTLQLAAGRNGINNDGQSTSAHVANFSDVVLTVHDVPADFNRDSLVNEVDMEIWAANFSTPFGADCTTGDADFDGDVDGLDFLLYQRSHGRATSPLSAIATVPEPNTMMCCAFGLLPFTLKPLRKHRPPYFPSAFWVLTVLCLMIGTPSAKAQEFAHWNVAAGAWGNKGNWSEQIVPAVPLEFDSARIDNGGRAIVNSPVNSIRDLEVTFGELVLESDFDLNLLGSAIVDSQGVLRLDADSELIFNAPNEFLTLSGGRLDGLGTVSFDSGGILNHGVVSPGISQDQFGSITVNGDYNQFSDGTLRLDLRGNQFEQLIVNGTAKLAGNLIIDFGNMNAGIDTFVPFFDGDISFDGGFDSVMFLSAPIGEICQGYNLDFPGTKGFWAGDMNLDGLVTAEDVQLFALALVNPGAYEDNRAATPSIDGYRYEVLASHMGNVDLLGTFNFDDIEAFAMKTNMPVSAVMDAVEAALREIPEPASTTLLLTTIALLFCLRTPSCRRCCW